MEEEWEGLVNGHELGLAEYIKIKDSKESRFCVFKKKWGNNSYGVLTSGGSSVGRRCHSPVLHNNIRLFLVSTLGYL